MNSDAWRSAQRSPTQFIHNYHHSCSATEAASLPVNAPGTYWAHRQSRISPSADVQTSSGLVKCWHETMGEEFGATRGSGRSGGGAELSSPQVLKLTLGSCAPRQRGAPRARGDRRRAALFPSPHGVLTTDYDKCRLGVIQRQPRGSRRNKITAKSVFIVEAPPLSLSPPSPEPLSSPPHKMFWRSSGFSLLL